MRILCAAAIAALAVPASAFYLPGTAPRDYAANDDLDVFVNAVTPLLNTTLHSLVSYDYYDERFHFCAPEGGPQKQPESLGSILFGDRILTSPLFLKMLKDETCVTICKSIITKEAAPFINDRIREHYGLNFIVDGLPSAEMMMDTKSGETFLDAQGFSLGFVSADGLPHLNNHYDITIQYHKRTEEKIRVVGVMVYPRSIDSGTGAPRCDLSSKPMQLSETQDTEFAYTYSVHFVASEVPWSLRWDSYLHIYDPKIHWFSLINSSVIVGLLCLMASTVLYRTISKDISRYNAIDLAEDIQEDYGWKLVHGEVFRAPQRPMVLSVSIGNGVHLLCMVVVTLIFALFGFLSPSNRGSLATVLLLCWTIFGCISGYISARVYTSLGGEQWKPNLVLTAVLFPSIVFTLIGMLNLFLIFAGGSGAVPFGTILAVLLLWFLISVPLSVAGYFYGMKHGGWPQPVRTNPIPRQIPPMQWYLKPIPAAIICGVLPFGAAFVELYYMLSSLFGNHTYYAFGFLFLTFGLVVLTTATITILFTYFTLCAEEYRWHWRSFLVGGGCAFWTFVYGFGYWASQLRLGSFTSLVLYFGYLFLFSLLTFLLCGSIGYAASAFAVHRLYSSVRVD